MPARRQGLVVRAASIALALSALAVLVPSCGLDELQSNPVTLVAQPVARRVLLPGGETEERRHLVDGEATDPEWAAVPFTHLAVGPEQGNQGGSFIASVKVVHDSARIYVLVQWPDESPDDLGPRLVWDPGHAASGCDSLLAPCSWRLTDNDEDRLAIMWEISDARDGRGRFRDYGCQVACHGNMHPTSGAVDIWQWRAARTNPIQFPITSSRVGFADDGYADGGGRVPDPGRALYLDNYRFVDCGGGARAPQPLKIPVAIDPSDRRPTTRINDFMRPCDAIWDSTAQPLEDDSRNPCREFEQLDVTCWVRGDDLPATLLARPASEQAAMSRHDVEARGRWELGVWTLEMSRLLALGNREDVDFDVRRAEPYYMALAVMNNSGRLHSGSTVVEVRFER